MRRGLAEHFALWCIFLALVACFILFISRAHAGEYRASNHLSAADVRALMDRAGFKVGAVATPCSTCSALQLRRLEVKADRHPNEFTVHVVVSPVR